MIRMVESRELILRLNANPFRPFQVRLSDGVKISVPVPRMMVDDDRILIVMRGI
jgi:hypothetical protein